MVLGSRKTHQGLEQKGYAKSFDRSDDHKYLDYTIEGIVMGRTKISHGPDHDLSAGRIRRMAAQCGLSKSQFIGVVSCTVSAEELYQIQLARLAERRSQGQAR